ncbi:hypothetical protein [Robertmurraya massiliosenegalensis]|uniref:hypothetical protein n=1 Tax=Robertmurraya massiliosenegalensis TaxID=1287657 RepID=UPI0002DFE3F9|nr:hypothetical protein [Robertmurraya massiliosenegalensis]
MEIKKTKGKIECCECASEKEGYKISYFYGTTFVCNECIVKLSNSLTEIVSKISFEKDLSKVE